MTVRDIYEALLIELNKVSAPSFLLGDFNYYLNKVIGQFINKKYNFFEINQQLVDDLRVLKTQETLIPQKVNTQSNMWGSDAIYEASLPTDYLHLLNCICTFKIKDSKGCFQKDTYKSVSATRLVPDSWGQILKDYYNRPSPNKPYYFISSKPTNQEEVSSKVITLGNSESTKSYKDRIEVRYGTSALFELVEIEIEYLKEPQYVELTPEQLDLIQDTSQVMEFPDYVCREITNELVNLVLESNSDPRLQSYIPVNQSIVPPVQQQK